MPDASKPPIVIYCSCDVIGRGRFPLATSDSAIRFAGVFPTSK